jgi:hypothetical protein
LVTLLSNGEGKDFVRGAFQRLAEKSKTLLLAAPYFTYPEPLLDALKRGSSVSLLVGLNSTTRADALRAITAERRTSVRFYTGRFHAKLYVFDEAVLVGSANLTESGFQSNREVVAWLSEPEDENAVDEARVIFRILWDNARSLSQGTLREFEQAWLAARRTGPDPDATIAIAVGKVEPPSVNVDSRKAVGVQVALERLRRQIQEEYKPAFEEVGAILNTEGLYREDVTDIDPPFRTNRFLNWLRLTHAPGDTWKEAPVRNSDERRGEVVRRGQEWCAAKDGRVYEGYAEGIQGVLAPFADPAVLPLAPRSS